MSPHVRLHNLLFSLGFHPYGVSLAIRLETERLRPHPRYTRHRPFGQVLESTTLRHDLVPHRRDVEEVDELLVDRTGFGRGETAVSKRSASERSGHATSHYSEEAAELQRRERDL
jgi:hypothetical protein